MEEQTKYTLLKSYLEGNDIAYPSELELENIVGIVLRQEAWAANEGHRVERIKDSPIEKAFHDIWMKWNEPRAGFNNGQGILQDLFVERIDPFMSRKWIADISDHERWIVATIIQWLGTNVGMSFLYEVFREVNMSIVPNKKDQ